MTPAERDEVRRRASDRLADHSMATVTSDERCACDRCDDDRAVLRYVPPGDAADSSGRDAWIAMHLTGSAKPDAARRLAHALHAAADAAEES